MADKTITYKGNETVLPEKPMSLGNGLKNMPVTAAEQVVVDFTTDKRLPEYIEEKTGMDLLWENASPNSNFDEQTLTISNLKNYKALIITFRRHDSADHGRSTETIPTIDGIYTIFKGKATAEFYGGLIYQRQITITDNVIKVSGAYEQQSNKLYGPKGDRLIPLYIWGIK